MIPEAAVEAAKSAIWDLTGAPVPFEWQRDIIARAALEAAAPHMLAEVSAQVWDETMTRAAEIAWEHDGSASSAIKTTPNPYRAAL